MKTISLFGTRHLTLEHAEPVGTREWRVSSVQWLVAVFLSFSFFTPVYAAVSDYAAPSQLPGVTPEMQTAGYWIGRHSAPDEVVLTPAQIAKFNARSVADGLISDLAGFPEHYDGTRLRNELSGMVRDLKRRTLYQENTELAAEAFYAPLLDNIGLTSIPATVDVRFGLVAERTDERLLPTGFALMAKAGDTDFDEVQNSALEVGAPVAVLWSTLDGRWHFVKDAIASGWVESEKVVLVPKSQLASYVRQKSIAVATAPKVDVFKDPKMTEHLAAVRMGTRLVLKGVSGKTVEVMVPERATDGPASLRPGFVAREDVSLGYLPYTPRTVLRQAFKLLGAPYGWGDARGGQDCSRFIQMVFATVGLDLPRNSGEQARAGQSVAHFAATAKPEEKAAVLSSKAVGGLTLLRLKGHIMLYLGTAHERFMVLHATWAYSEHAGDADRARAIGRVTLSDLSLGEGTEKGSLLSRLIDIRLLR